MIGRKTGSMSALLSMALVIVSILLSSCVPAKVRMVVERGKEKDIPFLIEALKDEDPLVRQQAAYELMEIGPEAKQAIPALVELYRHKVETWQVRTNALGAIGCIDRTGNIPILIEALKDEDPLVRQQASYELSEIVPEAMQAIPPLVEVFQNKEARQAIPALVEVLQNKDEKSQVRTNATIALKKITGLETIPTSSEELFILKWQVKCDIPEVVKVLKEGKNPSVRQEAAKILGHTKDDRTVEPLIGALKDPDEFVQRAAIDGLFNKNDIGSLQPLIEVVKTSTSMDVLHKASECLWKVGGKYAVAALIKVLQEKKESIRLRAAFAIGEMGPLAKDAIPSLIELLPGRELRAVTTSRYGINVATVPDGEYEARLAAKIDDLWSPQIMEERIESRAKGWKSYSPTQMANLMDLLFSSASGGDTESQKREKERKRLEEEAKEMQIAELENRYSNKYVRIDDVSAKSDDKVVTTVVKCKIRSVAYALSKITGADFGDHQDKWLRWWERHKVNY